MENESLRKLLRSTSNDDTATADDEKRAIAAEYNIPEQMADRLRGENINDLRADAQKLAAAIGTKKEVAPLGDPEVGSGEEEINSTDKACKNMLAQLFPERYAE